MKGIYDDVYATNTHRRYHSRDIERQLYYFLFYIGDHKKKKQKQRLNKIIIICINSYAFQHKLVQICNIHKLVQIWQSEKKIDLELSIEYPVSRYINQHIRSM